MNRLEIACVFMTIFYYNSKFVHEKSQKWKFHHVHDVYVKKTDEYGNFELIFNIDGRFKIYCKAISINLNHVYNVK